MKRYRIYGGLLESELSFPELPEDTWEGVCAADWTLIVGNSPPSEAGRRLGTRQLTRDWSFSLFETSRGWRFEFGKGGIYEVDGRNGRVVWYPGNGVPLDFVRSVVEGPVLALLLQQEDVLSLHGSAVEVGGGALAFVAPKFHGKSTLAIALTLSGGRLITDDHIAIESMIRPRVRRGVPSVRLFPDSLRSLQWPVPGRVLSGPKNVVTRLPRRMLGNRDTPLSAVYVLLPPAEEMEAPVRRTRLGAAAAAANLALRTSLADPLVGPELAGRKLKQIARLVSVIPVYELEVMRDLRELSAVADRLQRWHRQLRTWERKRTRHEQGR